MIAISLADILRARRKSEKLKELDEEIRDMLREAEEANNSDWKHDLEVLVQFFNLTMKQIEDAILGNPGGSLSITIADSKEVKAHYPVARILGVRDWPKEDSVYISEPGHEYYPFWRWFFRWCEGNGLVAYLEPLWTSSDARWYQIGAELEEDN